MKSIELDKEDIEKFDSIIIATDHDKIDYEKIKENSRLIIDTRGRYKVGGNVVRA